MKKIYFTMLAAGTLVLSSCGGAESTEEITYKLDAEASTLHWTGKYVSDGHTHTGTIDIMDGSMSFKGEEFVGGDFKVDLNSIKDADLGSPMSDTLDSHLKGPHFFNTSENSHAEVTVTEVTDKQIKATIKVMSKEIQAVMPLKIKKNEKELKAKGKFSIDFKNLDAEGFQAAPGDPENAHVDSVISFELDLVMNK
ncbi:MAG: YceI family protein [Bacteroidota bacterium]